MEIKGLHEKVDKGSNKGWKNTCEYCEYLLINYVNIVEKKSGIAPKNLGNSLDLKLDEKTIREIIKNYPNNSSIINIKEIVTEKSILDFPEATIEDINNIITSLNSNKAIFPDCIPLKIIKNNENVTDSHLACVINKDV